MSTWLRKFAGRSVFVTGHTGFKGSWLTQWLCQLGAKVHGYSLSSLPSPNNFEVSGLRTSLEAHSEADVLNQNALTAALSAAQPDVVFHLAAQALVRESYTKPLETFQTNVLGTLNLLEAVRKASRPCCVVIVTSDKCYENSEQAWSYRECDPMGGHDPYSASKGAAELAVASFRRSFFPEDKLSLHGIKVATVRAGNVIGGGDWAKDRIIPDAARALSQQQAIPVRNPRAIRPWQHVLEPLSGYLQLAAQMLSSNDPAWCSGWNFGPNCCDELPVQHLIELFCKAWPGGQWRDVSDSAQPHEANLLRLSIEKSQIVLGWRPHWTVTEAVQRSAHWYRRYYEQSNASMRAACLDDIEAYEKAMTR